MNDGITLQELPDAWEYCGLGEFCDFAGGTQPPKNTFKNKSQDGYIRLLQIRDFESEDYAVFIPKQGRLRIVQEEDISIGRYGASVGRILTGKAGAINVAIMTTLPDTRRVDKRFLGYSLQLSEFQQYLRGLGGRAAQAGFNRGEVCRFKFPLPPLCEQRKIAAVLGLVQRAIEQQERLIALTTELKKALLHKIFTEGLRGEPQKQTDIGPVPKSWEVAPLGEYLTEAQYGISTKGSESGQYAVLRMTNQRQGRISSDNLQYVELTSDQFQKFRVERRDILFNRTNSLELVGRTAIFDIEGDFVFASYLIRLRTITERLRPFFLNHYFNWDETQARLKSIATRAVSQSNISATRLRGFLVPVPKPDEQDKIVRQIDCLDQKLSVHMRKHAALTALFRALLHQLMTARVRLEAVDLSELGFDIQP